MKKILSCTLLRLCVLCFLIGLLPVTAPKVEAAASDSLTIRVGYFGGPYYEKTVMSVAELESLGAYWQTFTFFDAGGYLAYATAYGVGLTDILASAGVDIGSVGTCHFKTSDSASYHTSIPANTLYGSQRYAFPALAEYFGTPTGEIEPVITDYDAVWQSAVPVQTVLSLQDNYARVDEFTPYDSSCYTMQSGKRLRLFFGQTQPDEINARHMAYWVYGIDVEFAGSPVIQMQETDLELTVGEDHRVEFSVSAADPVIAEAIRGGLRWESSDPSVVSVDAMGQLTVLSKGEAVITVYFDDYEISSSLHIVVGDKESLGGGGEGNGSGDGTGDGSGAGDGTADGSGSGIADADQSGKENGEASLSPAEQQQPEETQSDYISATEVSEPVEETVHIQLEQPLDIPVTQAPSTVLYGQRLSVERQSTEGGDGGGGGAPIELVVHSSPLKLFLLLGMGLLMASGGILMWIKYKKEI